MTEPVVALFAPEATGEGSAGARAGEAAVDVLILTALQDELEAVLALGPGGRAGWDERKDQQGFRCYRRRLDNGRGGVLGVAAAWSGEMGAVAAAGRAQQLIGELDPGCLAMCGICAGYRKKVALGDVIVADQLYSYDEGKVVAERGKPPEVFHSLRTFDLQATWKMDAAFLARELDLSALSRARPRSRAVQRRWLLSALLAQDEAGGVAPAMHADRKSKAPDWTALVGESQKAGLVTLQGGRLSLTSTGREQALNDQVLHVDGLPEDPPFQVHVGAIATGVAVQEDPELFERLCRLVRTTLGVEMEGAAIGGVAARFQKRAIVVKAVSDHADEEKDDSFRKFVCRASAEVLLAFLLKHVEPARGPEKGMPEAEGEDGESGEHGLRGDRRMLPDRRDGFLARVERVAIVREVGALIIRHAAPSPFAGLLEVAWRDGALVDVRVVGALEQPISEALVEQYVREVEHSFRRENPSVSSTLVHGGPPASLEVARSALRRGVMLKSFGAYQGLIDFRGYLARQTARLEVDPVYPPWLYVEQPARWSLAGGREEQATERALGTLSELLEAPHPRLALVLGDFGAGKTFLLHELARRMASEGHRVVPVLVEMSRLEKQRSLKALLAQHFALADEGRIDLDAFQYMLAEGRIALLFDGFDELALRLTYDRALEHFETVIAAVQGNAKVVVTSRTQHFLTDLQVRRALAEKAEQVPGYRLIQLDKFGEVQIRRFLGNLIKEPVEAEERYRLLDEVKDLLGLSENPRMLGFIAKIAPEKLREAKEAGGEITAAKLYEILIGQWLEFEWERVNPAGAPKGVSRATLREMVTKLAGVFWERNAKTLLLSDFTHLLVVEGIEPAVVEHMIGSGSLLVRDAEGRFSFVHRSVMEWLVADAAAREVRETGDAAALAADEMSELMADFLISLAGRAQADAWAWENGKRTATVATKKNAARVRRRLEVLAGAQGGGEIEVLVTMDLEGQDLRGQDWSRVDWRGANLDGADLRSTTLTEAKLGGASMVGARLGHADLQGADLTGVDLEGAELGFARLTGADLRGVRNLAGARLYGAKLVAAQGVAVKGLLAVGAAPPVPGEAEVMWAAVAACNAVAWSPSGELMVSGHNDGSLRLWDAVTRQAIRAIGGHSGPVQSVAFSSDGLTFASGADDSVVRLWDVATARLLRAFEEHTNEVTSVAFSPDGIVLASGSQDKTVQLWDVGTARLLRAFEGQTNSVSSVSFSPDGLTLACGSDDSVVHLWDVGTARLLRVFKGHKNGVGSVAFSPDGLTLASGSKDETVRLWDVGTARLLRTFEGHTDWVKSVAFSPDGLTLASGSKDETVRLWDVGTARLLRTFEGHTDWVKSVAFSPDGKTLASGSEDMAVRLWDIGTARLLRAFKGHANWVVSVAFSPDGKTLASGSEDMAVRLWDVGTARLLRSIKGHTNSVWSVAFSRDGKTLASGSEDKAVRLWDVGTARLLRTFDGHSNGVVTVAFRPDGLALALGSMDNTVRLWDVTTGRALRALEGHKGAVWSVAFSPDGKTLASGSSDATVRLWDVAITSLPRALEGHMNGVSSVAFSPDGLTLASGSKDQTVRLWSVGTARLLRVFEGHTDWVRSVGFSPDGLTLASGSDDHTVRLWDVGTARLLRVFEGHTDWVRSVAFSPDGHTLASASSDGTIRLWSVATATCLAILLPSAEGWAAFTPDGRYKLGGDIAGSFWHVIGLCRFEPGELDPYLPHLRIPDDAPLIALPPGS